MVPGERVDLGPNAVFDSQPPPQSNTGTPKWCGTPSVASSLCQGDDGDVSTPHSEVMSTSGLSDPGNSHGIASAWDNNPIFQAASWGPQWLGGRQVMLVKCRARVSRASSDSSETGLLPPFYIKKMEAGEGRRLVGRASYIILGAHVKWDEGSLVQKCLIISKCYFSIYWDGCFISLCLLML